MCYVGAGGCHRRHLTLHHLRFASSPRSGYRHCVESSTLSRPSLCLSRMRCLRRSVDLAQDCRVCNRPVREPGFTDQPHKRINAALEWCERRWGARYRAEVLLVLLVHGWHRTAAVLKKERRASHRSRPVVWLSRAGNGHRHRRLSTDPIIGGGFHPCLAAPPGPHPRRSVPPPR